MCRRLEKSTGVFYPVSVDIFGKTASVVLPHHSGDIGFWNPELFRHLFPAQVNIPVMTVGYDVFFQPDTQLLPVERLSHDLENESD